MKGNRLLITWLLVSLAGTLFCAFALFCGARPFDIVTGRVSELASLELNGERFRIIQYWREDSYATQLEHTTPDGITTRHEIDGDDRKQWSCHVKIVEEERKLVITFPSQPGYREYFWDEKRLYFSGDRTKWM